MLSELTPDTPPPASNVNYVLTASTRNDLATSITTGSDEVCEMIFIKMGIVGKTILVALGYKNVNIYFVFSFCF